MASTLTSPTGGGRRDTLPLTVQAVIQDSREMAHKGQNGFGLSTEDISYTLTGVDRQAVATESILSFPSRFGSNANVTEGQAQSMAHSAGAPAVFRKSARAQTNEDSETWVALEAVRQELAKGNCVFYIDFEDSARGIFNRLKTLKCDMEKLKSFKYANPDEPLGDGIGEIMKTEIGKYLPTLIVVDGVNAAMNLLGLDLEKNKDATTFSQKVLKQHLRLPELLLEMILY